MSEERIPPSKQAYKEGLELADEIIRNIELAESSLTLTTLKTIRLARLTNDFDMIKILELYHHILLVSHMVQQSKNLYLNHFYH